MRSPPTLPPPQKKIWNVHLHEYVFISFSWKPQAFLCDFTLNLQENDQRRWSFSLKTITFENGLQSGKILKRYCYNDIVVVWTDCFHWKCKLLKTIQQAITNYFNYLDTQTIDFRWFLPFSIVFIFSCRRLKTIRKQCVDAIQLLRFH